jgi:hypothetical protein
VVDLGGIRGGSGKGEGLDSDLRFVHGSMELCSAAETANSPAPSRARMSSTARDTETKMQHFHVGNRHQIKDAPPNTWATVNRSDVVTMSELARRGFHLVDMSGEIWTMHREG